MVMLAPVQASLSSLSLHGAGAALRPFTTSSSMRQRKCTISCRSMEAGVGIFGTKAGMTSIYKDGNMLPVTVVALEPGNIVTQLKSEGREGYNSVQVGYRVVPDRKITKPERNHLAKAGAPPMKFLREFKVKDTQGLEPGQALNIASMFKEGDFVDVAGTSIGKGFQGCIKKYNFHRGAMTHGSKSKREHGSIGPGTTPGRVFKGVKMPGQMGNERVKIRKVEVLLVDEENGALVLKGGLPGKAGNVLEICPAKIVGVNV